MTSFDMLSGLAGGAQHTNTNIFNKAIENAGASSITASTAHGTTETNNGFKQEVMNGLGIGTALDVSV